MDDLVVVDRPAPSWPATAGRTRRPTSRSTWRCTRHGPMSVPWPMRISRVDGSDARRGAAGRQRAPRNGRPAPLVPFVPFGEMGSVELAGRIAAAFVEEPERARRGHPRTARRGGRRRGTRYAVDRLELVEVLCRAWRDALLVRAARAILAEAPGSATSRPGQLEPSRRRCRCGGRAGRGRGRVEHRKPPSALGQPARAHLPLAHVDERWFLDPAAIERARTPRAEPAAGRDVRGVRRFADQDRAACPFALRRWLRGRRDRDERPGVGVLRAADDPLGRSDLHDPAEVHHRDPVGDDPRQRQVVGDEQVGQPAPRAGSSMSRRSSVRIDTSSIDTGSSATMISGSRTSAPAMTTRWRWPPDSSCG